MKKYEDLQNKKQNAFDLDENSSYDYYTFLDIVTRSILGSEVLEEKAFYNFIDKQISSIENGLAFVGSYINLFKEMKSDLLKIEEQKIKMEKFDNINQLVDISLKALQPIYNKMKESCELMQEKFSKDNRKPCSDFETQFQLYYEAITIYQKYSVAEVSYVEYQDQIIQIEDFVINQLEKVEIDLEKSQEE